MSCKRGQSSLLGLPSAADIMKRATCFMRGNAPCGVKGVMGYALSARGIFAQRKNAECINRGLRFPRALPWAMGNIWAYSPPQLVYLFTRLLKIVRFQQRFLDIFGCARHNPGKLGFCARLEQTLSFLIKPRGILRSKMTKPRGKTLVFLTKPRGMNDFVKPNEQSSSLLEYSAMARNRTFKKGTLYAFFYPEKPFSPS